MSEHLMILQDYTTEELVNELKDREGAEEHSLGPEDRALIIFQGAPDATNNHLLRKMADGPARILVVID